MNGPERRLQEVEERLKSFEAPEPPERLLESLQAEIPEDLGEAAEPPRGGGLPRRYLRLAASLAVVAIGGVLGHRLLVEGPTPGEVALADKPTAAKAVVDATTSQEPEVVELGESVDLAEVAAADAPEATSPATAPPARELGQISEVAPQAEAPKPGSLYLKAQDETGAALPGISMTLEGADRDRVSVTDAQGEVILDDLQAGAYELKAELEGFGTVEYPRVIVDEARATTIDVTMSAAVEESLVVTSESPLLDERKLSSGATISQIDLEKIPAARDPWSELSQTPGVMVDRINVGGNESGQQSTFDRKESGFVSRLRRRQAPSTGGSAEPNDQPYGDMYFKDYGTNPFVDTEDDPLSTFGIDVDTASYTMTRSYLQRGSLPPAASVRVEEFVNFFDYGDRAPRQKDFSALVEGAPSPFASTARTHLLRFAIQGRQVSDEARKAAVLTFVVDVSGSMNRENRLGLVKRALRLLVGELGREDAIGLVVYGGTGRVILEPTHDHERVMAAIERLQPGGSTNAEQGLTLGYEMARQYFRDGGINRVVLCSDGVANVGATGPDSILSRIAEEADRGIELTTVGFGMGNYNDVLMEQLADRGDGNYAYVDDVAQARRVFVENLTGTLQTIAGDAKIQVEFEPAMVQSYRLLGYENRDIADRDFRNDAVDAGEIGAGHEVTALYEIKLRENAPRRGRVATLRLRYRSTRTGHVVEDSVDLDRSDLASRWQGASRGLRLAAVAAEFAEVLKGSYWARDTDLDRLAGQARDLTRGLHSDPDITELASLIETAARLAAGELPNRGGDGFEER